MIDWDERVSLWRVRHFKLAARMNGHSGIGTRGMPVEDLRRLVGQQLFPALWSARDVMAAPPDPA
jgi:tryptophan 2,3-dioxygenase